MKPTYGEQLGVSGIAANNLLRRKHKRLMFSMRPRLQFSHTRCTSMMELNEVSITIRQVSSTDQYKRWPSKLASYCIQYSLHDRWSGSIAVLCPQQYSNKSQSLTCMQQWNGASYLTSAPRGDMLGETTHGTTTIRHTGHLTTRYMICHPFYLHFNQLLMMAGYCRNM
jgi:hypothetical protein